MFSGHEERENFPEMDDLKTTNFRTFLIWAFYFRAPYKFINLCSNNFCTSGRLKFSLEGNCY